MSVRSALWLLIGLGVLARVVLAYATYGLGFDMDSLRLTTEALKADPLGLYAATDTATGVRWPYGPGFLPWLLVADGLDSWTPLPFHGTVQLLPIVCDAGIALLVHSSLGLHGAGERKRLAAVALIMFGPTYLGTSGYHGQIDSAAILAAVAAFVLWERHGRTRGASAGLLLGVGAAVKTVPLLVLPALLRSARSRREAAGLLGFAIGVPAALMLPFLISDFDAALNVTRNAGLPGFAGLSVVVQPDLTEQWLHGSVVAISDLNRFLYDHNSEISVAAVAGALAIVWWLRPAPKVAVAFTWLTVYVFAPDLFLHYLLWGLPFFMMAGYVRQVALLQLWLIVPTVILYMSPWRAGPASEIYAAMVIVAWLAALAAWSALLTASVRAARAAG